MTDLSPVFHEIRLLSLERRADGVQLDLAAGGLAVRVVSTNAAVRPR